MKTDNFWRDSNSGNVIWIATHRVTLVEFESDATYPVSTFPAPSDERTDADDDFRAAFWQSYLLSVALALFCVVLLAYWPV